MAAQVRRQRELRICPACGEPFRPPKASSVTCSMACRLGRPDERPAPPHPLLGRRVIVRLDDARCGERRTGLVHAVTTDRGRPLLTVRLDRGGWPGGLLIGQHHDSANPHGWRVDLREDEVTLA